MTRWRRNGKPSATSGASSPARWNSNAPPRRIGSSLEASPLVYVSDKSIFNTLFDIDLAEVFITSNAMATNEDAPADAFRLNEVPGVAVMVEKAVGHQMRAVVEDLWTMSARIPNTPMSRRATPRRCANGRRWE